MLLGLHDKAKIAHYRIFILIQDPHGQDKGAKTRPQGQLESANPWGSPGGMVRLGID